MNLLDLFENWQDTEEFEAEAVIFSENEPADFMYVILDGTVEISFHGDSLGVEKQGGIIGEMAVISDAKRNATARALTRVSLARLNRDQFRELIDQDSGFSFHAMATLANRLRAVDRFISKQLEP